MAPKLHIWVRDLLSSRTARKKGLFSEQAQGEEVDVSQVWPDTPSSNYSFSSSRSAFSRTSGKASDRLRHVVLFVCGRHDVDIPTFPFKDFLESGQPVAEKSADSFDSVGSASSFNSESSFGLDQCGPAFESLNSDSDCEDVTDSISVHGCNPDDAFPADSIQREDAAEDKKSSKSRRSKGVSKPKQRRGPRRRTKKLPPMPVLPDGHVMGGTQDHKESKRVSEFMRTLGTKTTMDKLIADGTLKMGRLLHSTTHCSTYSGQYRGQDVLIKEVAYVPGTVQEVKVLTDVRFLSSLQHKHIIPQLLCVVRDAADRVQAPKRTLVTVHPVYGPNMAYALKRFVFHDRCQGGKPKLRAILKVFGQVVDAVRSLHQDGIVHGGIRAESVQLTGGVRLHAVLSDFQLATKLKKDKVKLTSFMMGALGAVPPEMYEGVQVNGTRCGVLSRDTDMFCLGVLLWHAVCRQPPFKINKATQTQEAQSTFPLVIPNGLCKSVHFTHAEHQVLSRIETLIRELTNPQPWDRPCIADASKEVSSMMRFLDSRPTAISPQIKDLDPILELDSESASQAAHMRVMPTPMSRAPQQHYNSSPVRKPPLPVPSLSIPSAVAHSSTPSPPSSSRPPIPTHRQSTASAEPSPTRHSPGRGHVHTQKPSITIPESRPALQAYPVQLSPSLLPSPTTNSMPNMPPTSTHQTASLISQRERISSQPVEPTSARTGASSTTPSHLPLAPSFSAPVQTISNSSADGNNTDSPTSSFSGGSDWCPSEEGDVRVTASIHPNSPQDLFAPAPKSRPSTLSELLQQMTQDAEMFNMKAQKGLGSDAFRQSDQTVHIAVRT